MTTHDFSLELKLSFCLSGKDLLQDWKIILYVYLFKRNIVEIRLHLLKKLQNLFNNAVKRFLMLKPFRKKPIVAVKCSMRCIDYMTVGLFRRALLENKHLVNTGLNTLDHL